MKFQVIIFLTLFSFKTATAQNTFMIDSIINLSIHKPYLGFLAEEEHFKQLSEVCKEKKLYFHAYDTLHGIIFGSFSCTGYGLESAYYPEGTSAIIDNNLFMIQTVFRRPNELFCFFSYLSAYHPYFKKKSFKKIAKQIKRPYLYKVLKNSIKGKETIELDDKTLDKMGLSKGTVTY